MAPKTLPLSRARGIHRNCVMESSCGCWLYLRGNGDEKVYPAATSSLSGKQTNAHRVAWEEEHGPIPDGLSVLHRCDMPPCIRPAHLFLGTQAENNRDMARKGRHVGNIGRKASATTRQRQSESLRDFYDANPGHLSKSAEQRTAMSAKTREQYAEHPERRAANSELMKAWIAAHPEFRAATSARRKGSKASEETRLKMSIAQRKRYSK